MSELRTNRIVPRDGLVSTTTSSGGIIQVKHTIFSSTYSRATSSYNFGAIVTSDAITPTRADSKILIMMHLSLCPNASDVKCHYGVQRTIGGSGATSIGVGDAASSRMRMSGGMLMETNPAFTVHYSFLDSPSTTSACAYYPLIAHDSGSSKDFSINKSNGDGDNAQNARYMSSIILYEVSG